MKPWINRSFACIVLICTLFLCLAGCADEDFVAPAEKPESKLRVGVLEGAGISLTFGEDVGEGITLGGKEYNSGDKKPFWQSLERTLGIEIIPKGEIGASEISDCDIIIGSHKELDTLAREDKLVDFTDYFSQTPRLKEYLFSNDLIFLYSGEPRYGALSIYSIPAKMSEPEITLAPYFDPEIVKLLLDSDVVGSNNVIEYLPVNPYMPDSGCITVDILKDGNLEKLTKNYDVAGNVISIFKLTAVNGGLSGDGAITALRSYIDQAYGGFYGEARSDLFLGESAAYDADELAALLVCAALNSELISSEPISPLSAENINEAINILASLYGVRGLNENGYTYVTAAGELRDSRLFSETYALIDRLNDWLASGLITVGGEGNSMLAFGAFIEDEHRQKALLPIAKWYSGENKVSGKDQGIYQRFTENVSFAGEVAVAISEDGINGSNNKLTCALAFIEYVFTEEGSALLSSDAMLEDDQTQIEKIKDTALMLGYNNVSDYLSDYYGIGALVKPKVAFSEEETAISKAYRSQIVKTVTSDRFTENKWYLAAPVLLPYSEEQYAALSDIPELSDYQGEISYGYEALKNSIVEKGLISSGYINGDAVVTFINSNWKRVEYVTVITDTYYKLGIFYLEYINGVEY